MSTALVVNFGPYFGFTIAELNTELARYKAAVKQSFSRLHGSSINGQSFTFGDRTDGSLEDWQIALQSAFYYMDPGLYPFDVPTKSSAVTFR
jgi:hypothetical protein